MDNDKINVLREADFGNQVAEQESEKLSKYFVETNYWRKLYNGDVDVVYGTKGSGKSALYSLLVAKRDNLFDDRVLISPAEQIQGSPVFKDIIDDAPTSEKEFSGLWKLYFLKLISNTFKEYGFGGEDSNSIHSFLVSEKLGESSANLKKILNSVAGYVKNIFRLESIEGGAFGAKGKIVFREPSVKESDNGYVSIDELMERANSVLESNDFNIWITIDRLDVAFSDNIEIEKTALRALFRVYLDMIGYNRIGIKIFLRTDIWERISSDGFREASHITKTVKIAWDNNSLMNLIVRRMVYNNAINNHYNVNKQVLDSIESQKKLFYRIFPEKVDAGEKSPSTFDWMISRIQDGKKEAAPREIIHLMIELLNSQLKRHEVGEASQSNECLFDRTSFKQALPIVSQVRIDQTIYAEFNLLKPFIEKMKGEKTKHNIESLSKIWENCDVEKISGDLVDIGFFERRGTRSDPEFWVPFLYRDGLGLIQGSAF